MSSISRPRIHVQPQGGGVRVVLQGQWNSAELTRKPQWLALQRELKSVPAAVQQEWELEEAQGFDHVAAQILWLAWGESFPHRWSGHEEQRAIMERVARLTVGEDQMQPASGSWSAALQHVGGLSMGALVHFRKVLELVGQLLLDLLALLRKPLWGPWRDFSAHLFRMGAQALPITALVGFLIGVVIAYLLALQLRQFGADAFIVNILGISLTRELGPLLAAILVAGRSGSAITAQIGVMRVNEELDAMRVMGIALGFRLVMPRAMALAVAMPLVSVWTTLAALVGGIFASQMALDISPAFFMEALPEAVDVANLYLGVAKSVVFGVVIALIGCHWGLWVKPNTESLGQGTTASVVTSITAVILIDAVFAILFRNVGF